MLDYFHVDLRQSVTVLLPLDSTVEVITLNMGQICPIPGTPPAVLGVVNQRGRLLWVLDLSDLLGLAPPPKRLQSQQRLTLVVVTASSANSTIGQAEPQLGCVVSALKGIVLLEPAEFKPVPAIIPQIALFSSGVAEIEQSQVAVLNVNAVLSAVSVPSSSLIPL